MQFGWTLLHTAAFHGHLNLVKKLIKVCKLSPEALSKVHPDELLAYMAIRRHMDFILTYILWQCNAINVSPSIYGVFSALN